MKYKELELVKEVYKSLYKIECRLREVDKNLKDKPTIGLYMEKDDLQKTKLELFAKIEGLKT